MIIQDDAQIVSILEVTTLLFMFGVIIVMAGHIGGFLGPVPAVSIIGDVFQNAVLIDSDPEHGPFQRYLRAYAVSQ